MYGYVPHSKQEKFHKSTKQTRIYIGGNRSGKTTGGVVEDLWWCTGRHPYRNTPEPPVRGRVISVDFVNGIEKIIRPEVARWCPVTDLRGGSWSSAYDKLTRTLYFENGSFLEFMSYDQDLDKFAGTSRHFIHFDEEAPEEIYIENRARIIDTGGELWFTMTPVEGMTWIYDTLYMPGKEENEFIDVIEVDMTENPHLHEGEVQAFLQGLSDDEREARVHGRFVQLGGLVYKEFDPKIHVMDSFVPPMDWLWIASLDHGFNNPTAWLWHAVNPDGRVFTFFEHYESGHTVDYHARKVHEINKALGRAPEIYIGDPSIRNTDPITGTSIHQEYIKYGVPIVLGNNDVVAGINRVAQYLKPAADGQPNLLVTRNCVNLIWEMQRYRWKVYANKKLNAANNKYEQAHKRHDHATDALRYMIMSRPDLVAGHFERHVGRSGPLEGFATTYSGQVEKGWHGSNSNTKWEYDEHLGIEY
jgi:phage terminase large subunit-like protein